MPASFLHGVEVSEFNLGPVPITVVNSAVAGIVGTAPLFAVPGAIPLWDPSWLVSAEPAWSALTAETVGNLVVDSNGNTQKCTTAGTTGAGAPNWAVTLNSTTTDGTAVWTLIAIGATGAGQKCVDANGNVQTATAITLPVWAATHAYSQGNLIVDSNGNTQRVTSAGTTGSSAPTWATTVGATTADSGVTWTLVALGKAALTNTSAPTWATTLNSTTADTESTPFGSITWTLTQLGPITNLQQPVLIAGSNPASSTLGQAGTFGPLIQGYSIPYALAQFFASAAGQAIVVNVFDQTKHYSTLSAQTFTFPASGNQVINIGHMGLSAIKVTNSGASVTYVEGIDFTVDKVNGLITALGGGFLSAGQAVKVTCNYADPSQVNDAALVGTVASNVYTGMQCWLLAYNLMGFFPKILIAPSFGAGSGWQSAGSQDATVAAGLATIAPLMRAVYLLDCPPATPPATLIADRGTLGNSWDTSDQRALLCGPQELFTDNGIVPTGITISTSGTAIQNLAGTTHAGPYSNWVAGVISATDLAVGPWESPSNEDLPPSGPLGPDTSLAMSYINPASDTNNLNAAGIVTAFAAFATGLRVWGNRSAAYPSYTTPNVFIAVRRTADLIEDSIVQAMLQFLDQPLTAALIDTIIQSVNAFMRTLIQQGGLIDGKCSFNPAENPVVNLEAGHLTLDIDMMPPTPMERLTFNVFLDGNLLSEVSTQVVQAQGTVAA
jgi:uncharacterized protein